MPDLTSWPKLERCPTCERSRVPVLPFVTMDADAPLDDSAPDDAPDHGAVWDLRLPVLAIPDGRLP